MPVAFLEQSFRLLRTILKVYLRYTRECQDFCGLDTVSLILVNNTCFRKACSQILINDPHKGCISTVNMSTLFHRSPQWAEPSALRSCRSNEEMLLLWILLLLQPEQLMTILSVCSIFSQRVNRFNTNAFLKG